MQHCQDKLGRKTDNRAEVKGRKKLVGEFPPEKAHTSAPTKPCSEQRGRRGQGSEKDRPPRGET